MMTWISVKDKLPEEEGFYMTKTNTISMTPSIKIEKRYYKTYKNHLEIEVPAWGTMSDQRVTHWMPLPDPPKI